MKLSALKYINYFVNSFFVLTYLNLFAVWVSFIQDTEVASIVRINILIILILMLNHTDAKTGIRSKKLTRIRYVAKFKHAFTKL